MMRSVNTALESTAEALPNVGAGLDTHAGPTFVQDRLRLLGKTVFLLSFGFYVAINGLYIASGVPPGPLLTMHHNVMHLIASSVMGVVWVVMQLRPWPMRRLGAIDAASIILAGVMLALMSAMPMPELLMSGIMALSVTLLARAVLIPSTAKRTLILSVLSALPLQITALVVHSGRVDPHAPTVDFLRFVPSVSTFLWLVIAVTLSAVASRTIYGLRRQVKEAAEIGQYTLVERIGSGGMGEVWRARHRMLIRPAAVKLVRPNMLGPAERELLLRRFEREAHATAGLKSPHTVQLYDFGVADDGTLYYVMELLDGMDLDTMVDRFGPMPSERVIHLLHQVSASLDDAHQNGLVHRDIKPANIVVSRFGAAWDFVKVLDFGLVKLEGSGASEANIRLTADGSSSGTPAFMAPEVALGEQATDHRVDIYSLGCVAYWLVTGKLIFDGPSAVKVMVAHAHTPPPPPSSRTELPIPPELEALILECLEKDPARRPASAEVLQARLQAIPIATPWTRERAERWWSEHAPHVASVRPVADVLLSQEARPVRVIRQARPT
jgi:eukaryotic-like serine/threonine-protein kinase